MIYLQLATIRRKLLSVKALFFLVLCVFMFIHIGSYLQDMRIQDRLKNQKEIMNRWHATALGNLFAARGGWTFSKMGGILFNREEIPNPNPNANRTFVILVWQHWKWLKKRHVYKFKKPGRALREDFSKFIRAMKPVSKVCMRIATFTRAKLLTESSLKIEEIDILEGCSVKNCLFYGNESYFDTADAVVVHLQKGLLPTVENRSRTQKWIFLNDESPRNAFSLAKKKPKLHTLYDMFNWSMTYRSDADVPVPYGRVIALDKPLHPQYMSLNDIAATVPNWGRKKMGKVAAVIMSNCAVKTRNNFLKELRQYVKVDVFGRCADQRGFKFSCPGHFKKDCDPVAQYIFYLVLENTSCRQYLTEKAFYHAYAKGAIPIIFGPTLEDVEALLPPDSYLYADADTNIELLAKDINAIANNSELILSMHMWRNHFKIVNEHGYFGTKSYHLCRLCEALNYNDDKEKVYNKELLDSFLDPKRTCYDKKSLNF